MVKIKTKKKLNLPQLIEYAWDNGITNKEYICDGFEIKSVVFNLSGWAEFSDEFSYNPHDTFTVEVEEEITEDTKLEKAVEVYSNEFDSWDVVFWEENSVRDILATNIGNIEDTKTETIHIVNDDGTHTLIWRDGRLVK